MNHFQNCIIQIFHKRTYYLICVSAHDKILISLLHQIQYRVNNSMTRGRIHEEGVKFVEIFRFRFANKDLQTSVFRSSSKWTEKFTFNFWVYHLCKQHMLDFEHFMENKNGSIFLAARGRLWTLSHNYHKNFICSSNMRSYTTCIVTISLNGEVWLPSLYLMLFG